MGHPDGPDGTAAAFLPAGYATSAMKRTTSCGPICIRVWLLSASMPRVRRSSLKSPSWGEMTIASIPAALARSIRVSRAPSPAGSWLYALMTTIRQATRDDALILGALTLQEGIAAGGATRPGFVIEFADAWLAQCE